MEMIYSAFKSWGNYWQLILWHLKKLKKQNIGMNEMKMKFDEW